MIDVHLLQAEKKRITNIKHTMMNTDGHGRLEVARKSPTISMVTTKTREE